MRLPEWTYAVIDIDDYLDRFIPAPRLYLLPRPLARFLGHRDTADRRPGSVLIWIWSFVGAFIGLVTIQGITKSSHIIQRHEPPIIIGSFGAAAILEYNAIESPFSQPRNAILGHFLAATVGVAVTKLFQLLSNFEDVRYLAGAVACALASSVMGMTKTVHPPAGATALIAAVDPVITNMGWYLLPLVLLSSILMLVTAQVINNIQRRFPEYWWTPTDLRKKRRPDVEKEETSSQASLGREQAPIELETPSKSIIITLDSITVPAWTELAEEEREILEILQDRLRIGHYS